MRVSPLSLGTMTFGTDWGFGADQAESQKIFDIYADRGGNFIDTANIYTNGSSESFLGQMMANRRDSLSETLRDRYAIASLSLPNILSTPTPLIPTQAAINVNH
jgi:aryl-alcohol dehydrogenase-like predicted oxidoreductase